MGLNKHIQSMVFDTRLIEWGQRHGMVTEDEVKKHLEALPDEKDKSQPVNIEVEDNDDDDDHMFS